MSQLDLIDPAYKWDVDGIAKLHLSIIDLLREHLEDPHISKDILLEDMEWVAQDILPEKEFKKTLSKHPYEGITFQACCSFTGFDPEDVQLAYFQRVKELGLHKWVLSESKTSRVRSKVKKRNTDERQSSLF